MDWSIFLMLRLDKYTNVFFDLDQTLWDFERNAHETLTELFKTFELGKRTNHSSDEFIAIYSEINEAMWALYREDIITKEELRFNRYRDTYKACGIESLHDADKLGDAYIQLCPTKTHLIPGCIEILEYLKPKYRLHIITNGFSEIQAIKMKSSGLEDYFEITISSEAAGAKKPKQVIYDYALRMASCTAEESLIIGDNYEADIVGGMRAGWGQVYFNPEGLQVEKEPTAVIKSLLELQNMM